MLRNKNFIFLWFVNATTTLAIELFNITILVTIYEQTESTLLAAGTMVARTLPAFLLGPVAGVLVDRFPRKNMIIFMDLIRLIVIAFVIWFIRSDGKVSISGFYLIIAGLSTAGVFSRPARMSLIPSLVSQEQLVKANSFIMTSNLIMMAISFTIGGWLIITIQLQQIAMLVTALFAMAILAAMFIKAHKPKITNSKTEEESFWQSLISGWTYLWQHPIARPLTIMEAMEHLPHGIWTGALMLAFTNKALQGDATDWGYQLSGFFAGMILGSIGSISVIGNCLRRYPGRIIIVNAFAVGIFTLAYAISPNVWMAVTWSFLFGLPFAIRDVAQDSLLQSMVSENQLGRVYATREMLWNAIFMFAGIFFAWLSDFMSIRIIYIIGGLLYILTGFYALSNKALRKSNMEKVPVNYDNTNEVYDTI